MALSCAVVCAQDEGIFGAEAAKMAKLPYVPGYLAPTPFTKNLNYSDLQKVRIKRSNWIFNKSQGNLQIEPLLAGSFNSKGIQLNILEQGNCKPIPFRADLFDFPKELGTPEQSQLSGFNGFRVHGAPRTGSNSYEQFSFSGASYFRGHAEGLSYGLSARGLILRHGEKEEFPLFESFAFEEPSPSSSELVFHALLNSPSVTGAYRIVSKPGNPHVMEVHASVYLRDGIKWEDVEPGIGGFSSMYWFSPAMARRPEDFRERVHDSEVLCIRHDSGERVWRVLGNPARVRESLFPVQNLRGFGLIQRERRFSAYEDEFARYEKRTSAWVEPISGMENGSVKLIEIPTKVEYQDNIVAFYRPASTPPPGQPLRFAYRVLWCDDAPSSDLARILQTRIGRMPDKSGITVITIDFEKNPAGDAKPEITLPASLTQKFCYLKPLPDGGTLRLHLGVIPRDASPADPSEIRAHLIRAGKTVSETWIYPWNGPDSLPRESR